MQGLRIRSIPSWPSSLHLLRSWAVRGGTVNRLLTVLTTKRMLHCRMRRRLDGIDVVELVKAGLIGFLDEAMV